MINYHTVGCCCHPETVVLKGGSLKNITFPALVAYLPEQQLLFDTGYAEHFFTATQRFPEWLYPRVTPVTFDQAPIVEQLAGQTVRTLFISHVHGDHIAGLKDFPEAQFVCSRAAYDFTVGSTCRVNKLRQGVLPTLLPDDFRERVTFIEDLPVVNLADDMQPFSTAYEVAPNAFAIDLPGHAIGHYGLYLPDDKVFLIADAVWQFRTIADNRRPAQVTRLLMHDWQAYHRTIDKLQALHRHNPDLLILPSHCQASIDYAQQLSNIHLS